MTGDALGDLVPPDNAISAVAQEIAARFDLGSVRRVERVSGAGYRNAVIETDSGAWILRAGVDPATLSNRSRHLTSAVDSLRRERYFAAAVRRVTGLAAPWPYEIDDTGDLLPTAYAVMPRLDGRTLSWWGSGPDFGAVGDALAEAALQLHRPAWPAAGDWSPAPDDIVPDPRALAARVRAGVADLLDRIALTSEPLDPASARWVEEVVAEIDAAPEADRPSLVHGDLVIGNVCLAEVDDGWSVTGVFDLENARVGDAEEDLAGPLWWACYGGRPESAASFLRRYARERPISPRLRVHLVVSMLENWELGRSHHEPWYGAARTFGEWARPLFSQVEGILAAAG